MNLRFNITIGSIYLNKDTTSFIISVYMDTEYYRKYSAKKLIEDIEGELKSELAKKIIEDKLGENGTRL